MRADLRLAWLLTSGSDRREWWRIGLTAVGAAGVAAFGAMAAAVASVHGYVHLSLTDGLLDAPGERSGVLLALLLLLVPGLGFLGQCARLGAVHRDRRMARLRLAGAAPVRVRRIAALEAGVACLAGSIVGSAAVAACVLYAGRPPARLWWLVAAVLLAVPVVGVAVSLTALRRVVASPLGEVRRLRGGRGGGRALALGVFLVVVAVSGGILAPAYGAAGLAPMFLFWVLLLVGAGALGVSGGMARLAGRRYAARAESPALLIAAERLSADPWAAARTHAAVLLVTVAGTGFVGVRKALLEGLHHNDYGPTDLDFYTAGIDLAGAAVLVGLLIVLVSVAVSAAESVAARRRALARQVAAGVPRKVLRHAVLLETALPLAPALLIAGAGGLVVGIWYASLVGHEFTVPYTALAVPPLMLAACLLSVATSLPLLRRSARPAELRHA
ncbi:FtsX-like permease family protein [Streptomyces montanisoli]|uniref:ABC transporter permease n=1 Tax=Streptomyces montanisoli TaxID=2798581 RepID=A0A940RWD6_9ACTN|nr:FtsX-like permease family protein [Streptomyces montanisoli]MBP0457013.1 ABC transporter permease [Streptomyces montanisoli]